MKIRPYISSQDTELNSETIISMLAVFHGERPGKEKAIQGTHRFNWLLSNEKLRACYAEYSWIMSDNHRFSHWISHIMNFIITM